jgi:hypothetical protein
MASSALRKRRKSVRIVLLRCFINAILNFFTAARYTILKLWTFQPVPYPHSKGT